MTFEFKWPSCFRGEYVWRTDDRWGSHWYTQHLQVPISKFIDNRETDQGQAAQCP